MPAIVPLGVALGVALGALAVDAAIAWSSAPLMVAGASQLVLFSQLDSGSSAVAAGVAAVLLNSRFIVYGAALAPRFGTGQPTWFRWLGPHYIVDQTYAMTLAGVDDDDGDDAFRQYFVAAGTALWAVWCCSVGLGILLGPMLPTQLGLEFVLPATFVALIVPGLSRRSEVLCALLGATVATLGIDSTTTMATAAVVGAVIGWTTNRGRR
jgi:predicted branched-subunit amino acid permease